MQPFFKTPRSLRFAVCALAFVATIPIAVDFGPAVSSAQTPGPSTNAEDERPSLAELKRTGYQRSRFKELVTPGARTASTDQAPQANLKAFEATIKPLLEQHCIDCHGSGYVTEGNIRIDTLDPDSVARQRHRVVDGSIRGGNQGRDATAGGQARLDESDRNALSFEWLTDELQAASILRRNVRFAFCLSSA